ncbi:MAG TPA: hypothetical protein VMA95_12080 [Streptosporangiaceae bacterium]|nr:hypothetical protein [Streptosporangiaceae bacterium]
MAKHRRARSARSRLMALLRGGGIVGALVLCVFAGARLVSFAAGAGGAGAAGGGHAASLGGSKHATLTPRPAGGGQPSSPAGSGGQGTTGSSSGSPSPSASRTPAAHLSGSEVTAVGDSVMVAATPALDEALPGISINAVVGRQFYTGLQVIAELKSEGQLRPVVVVGLGTNGTVTASEISQLYAEIGPGRRLVLVNTYEARSWEQEVNTTLATAVTAHQGTTVLADWYDTIKNHTDLLWPDGIHPQPAGGVVYAKMLKAALEKVASLPA